MKISTNTTHDLTFAVEAFWSEEGGMGCDSFGNKCADLHQALHLLELAKAQDSKIDWIITINVKTVVSA